MQKTDALLDLIRETEPKKIKRSYNLDETLVDRLAQTAKDMDVTQTHLLDKLLTYGLDKLDSERT